MIVDSPGVGESDVMSSFVLNYLPRAFCFMYVLSASNAGGIQHDRVRTRITGYYKPIVRTLTKFSNVIGYHQPDLSINRTVYASCL